MERAVFNETKSKSMEPEKLQLGSRITFIWCTLEFIGFHRWKDAEGQAAFLRMPHRHKFYVKASKRVHHGDREIEFITMKNTIQEYVDEKYHNKTFDSSCEMIASDILEKFDMNEVSVSEDGENGSTVFAL